MLALQNAAQIWRIMNFEREKDKQRYPRDGFEDRAEILSQG